MPLPSRLTVRSRLAPMGITRIALGAMIGLSWGAISGCSSPSRGPEVDIVEVERIEVLPMETAAPVESEGSSPPADEKAAGPSTESVPPATDAGPAAEEVPVSPAAN